MHPVLVATFIVNTLIANSTFGILGLLGTLFGAAAVYTLISKNGRDRNKYWAQILSIAFGHLVGFVAVVKAPWANPLLIGTSFIINILVISIFTALGKR